MTSINKIQKHFNHYKAKIKKHFNFSALLFVGLFFIFCAVVLIWISTISIPDFSKFENRKVSNSTKIYDRTGKILLYDLHKDIKRTSVPIAQINPDIINATIAIEDEKFYEHKGFRIKSILRSFFQNFKTGELSQGGSTITQQIIKNTLLTKDKTITRKIKELILSVKLEKSLAKEQILEIYLNESPYGGNIYGVEEASKTFFGKTSGEVTLAESAYLASLPNAPSFLSPYGLHKDSLESRKNTVLMKMKELGFIDEEKYNQAKSEIVTFLPEDKKGIRAPHFVMYLKQYLEEKYGEKAVYEEGLSVISTLDYEIQEKSEEIIKQKVQENIANFGGTNAAMVTIDPKTGQVLSLIGSRDYFDKEIDGNFDVATQGLRQPGSSFKSFVYTLAFQNGYKPETVLFDIPTEFNASCSPSGQGSNCYSPEDFDGKWKGPMTLRSALGESRNVPAVKLLYLVGIKNAINFARSLGITTLTNADLYGLTLVLGGGEVKLIDMTSAYGVFANNGIKEKTQSILEIKDRNGVVLEKYEQDEEKVISPDAVIKINDVLSDNNAKAPTFGNSLAIPGHDVAVKTGTTNDYKDVWAVGYTPSIVVGVWVGNNDNTPMKKIKQVASAASIWRALMSETLKKYPNEPFQKDSYSYDKTVPPVINGLFYGGDYYEIDNISKKLATDLTPEETRETVVVPEIHTILHWINKNNLLDLNSGNVNDSQYKNWEYGVQNWWSKNSGLYPNLYKIKPTEHDDIHIPQNKPLIQISPVPALSSINKSDTLNISITKQLKYPFQKYNIYVNDVIVDSVNQDVSIYPLSLKNIPSLNIGSQNKISITIVDSVFNKNTADFSIVVN